ncbi:GIY-YIG nuclease family protein [Branchiibius cervicis]|uniref:GIY-YIG nuclease family protein n=1 Tax=Branchiibius cervicis TaxID=908252 RepID=A0ABW2AVD8_9MICO
MAAGKQVRLFLVDGTAGGLITAEIMNWTGHVLKGTRDKLAVIRSRPEAQRTGVYILLGEDEQTGDATAYIGQSDDVAKRLTHHDRDEKKAFWNDVLVITSKDQNLTSAHVRYLESRLVRLAKSIGRTPLANSNEPTGGADLPEADASDMEYFVDQLRVVLPVLGVDIFRGRETRSAPTTQPSAPADQPVTMSPVFHLRQKKGGIDAQAQVIDGEFTVLAGSRVAADMPTRTNYSSSSARQYERRKAMHSRLLTEGSITVEADGAGRLTRDVVFSSPSAAGAVVQGTVSTNGRTAWVAEDGTTFADWESREQGVDDPL